MKSYKKLRPCLMEPMSVSSKMDQTLAKANPIIMLEGPLGEKKKTEKKICKAAVALKPMEIHRREIHLQPVEDPMLEQGDAKWRLQPCGKPVLDQDKCFIKTNKQLSFFCRYH